MGHDGFLTGKSVPCVWRWVFRVMGIAGAKAWAGRVPGGIRSQQRGQGRWSSEREEEKSRKWGWIGNGGWWCECPVDHNFDFYSGRLESYSSILRIRWKEVNLRRQMIKDMWGWEIVLIGEPHLRWTEIFTDPRHWIWLDAESGWVSSLGKGWLYFMRGNKCMNIYLVAGVKIHFRFFQDTHPIYLPSLLAVAVAVRLIRPWVRMWVDGNDHFQAWSINAAHVCSILEKSPEDFSMCLLLCWPTGMIYQDELESPAMANTAWYWNLAGITLAQPRDPPRSGSEESVMLK